MASLNRLEHATTTVRWDPASAERPLRQWTDAAFDAAPILLTGAAPDGSLFSTSCAEPSHRGSPARHAPVDLPRRLDAPRTPCVALARGEPLARGATVRHLDGLSSRRSAAIVRLLRAALDMLTVELARAAAEGNLDRPAVVESLRRSDYLLVHLADSQRVASLLSDPCLSSTAFFTTSRSTRAPIESSKSVPTTPGQLVLLDLLARELREMGLTDVERDANGYLFATIDATPGVAAPTVGFLAHVDTSPEMSGAGVRPIVHRHWSGEDIGTARRSDGCAARVGLAGTGHSGGARHRHGIGYDTPRCGRQGGCGGNHGCGRAPDAASGDPARSHQARFYARRRDRTRTRIISTWRDLVRSAPTRSTVAPSGSWSSRASRRMRWW